MMGLAMAKKPGKPKSDRRPMVLGMRGSEEWSEWLTRLADHYRTTRVGVVDRALSELAQRGEFEPPPKR